MKRIAALVDHSVYAESVCDHAAWLIAGRGMVSIDIIHVVSPYDLNVVQASLAGMAVAGPGVIGSVARLTDKQLEELTRKGEALVDRMTTRVAQSTGAVVVGRVVVAEWPDVIADVSATFDMIVMGKRGENADFVRLTLGTIMDQVARTAGLPLLAVPRSFKAIDRWLVAFADTSDISAGIDTVAQKDLLPPRPCTLIYAGEATDSLIASMEIARAALETAGHNPAAEVIPGQLVEAVATRVVKDDVGLVATGGFRAMPLFPVLFGEGTANELTRACLTPVLVLR